MTNELVWHDVVPLSDVALIEKFEKAAGYVFPKAFKACVSNNNGGRPSPRQFDTAPSRKGTIIKSLLSFNRGDRKNIWIVNRWGYNEPTHPLFIAFAIDAFGNLICFDISDNSVILCDYARNKIAYIAKDFEAFLNLLY